MKKIKDNFTNEIIINKSQFITNIYRISSVDEALEILQSVRKKYYDATHNCYAYILGENQNIQKCSDDGEPSKTAGFPILDCLKKNDLTDILCIVTRYFGGIMLGAGGLVRAYSQSTSEVIKKASLYEIKKLLKINLTLDYSTYNQVLSYINNYYILDTSFTSNVNIILGIEENIKENFIQEINNLSNGNAIIEVLDLFDIEVLT